MSYQSTILADGATYYYRCNEASGTAATDSADSNAGTYVGTVSLGQPGLPGTGDTSAQFTSGSSGEIDTATSLTNPAPPFTLERWFQVANAYGSGGTIVGFDGGASYDRKIWMDNSGVVHWGIYNGTSTVILSSTSAYNDGNWHLVQGVIASNGNMSLIVDGQLVSSNSNTTSPQSYTGTWKWNWGNTTNWPNVPTNPFLVSYCSQAIVYAGTALSVAQGLSHYNLGAGSPVDNTTKPARAGLFDPTLNSTGWF